MKTFFKKIWDWIISIPQDKLLHDYAGALITLFCFVICLLVFSFWTSFIVADSLAVAALVGKEIYDYFHQQEHGAGLKNILFGIFGMTKIDLALLILLPSIGA